MSDLKPCPCCNGVPWVDYRAFTTYVYCDKCGLRTKAYNTEAEAIEAWNTRTYPESEVMLMGDRVFINGHGHYVKERTCHVEGSCYDELLQEDYTDLSCGHHLRGAAWEFDFCPVCGAKVVSE